MLRLTGDLTTLKDGLARSLPPLVQAAAVIPAATAALFWVNRGFGMVTLLGLALSLAMIAVTAGHLRKAHEALRNARARLAADMAERVPIAPELARLRRRGRELSRLGKATARLRERSERRLVWVEMLRASPGVMTGALATFILHAGADRGLADGELAAALAALGLLAYTLAELAEALDRLLGWQVAREKLASALKAQEPAAVSEEGRVRLGTRRISVQLAFAAGVASPVRLDLEPGARGAIRAKDPARLVQCLTGKVVDDRVRILVDDIPLHRLSAGTLRRSIHVVDTQPLLLKGSVRRNLCLGLSERPTDENLLTTIEKAGLGALLQQFGGLNGSVPEGGRSMTGKDRTGLAILRAAVQRAGLIVVAASPGELPDGAPAYLERTRSAVLRVVPDVDAGAQIG